MNFHASLQELLAAARKRAFSHILVRELLLALAVAFGAAALVVFVGSGNVGWMWVPIAAVGTLIVRLILKNRKRPSEYALAQQVDDRLKLADTLSTAAYFASPNAQGDADPALRDLQRARAEETARSVDIKKALPMHRPPTLVPAAIAALIVAGVFLLRFTATGSFDTKASLVEGPLKSLLQPAEKQARAEKKPGDGTEPANGEDTKDLDKNRDYAGEPETQQQETAENPETPDQQKSDQQKGEGKGEQATKDSGDQQQQQNAQNPQDSSQQANQDGQQQESLMDKMKDALSDLMNKVKPSSNKQSASKNGKKGDKQPGDKQDQSSDNDDKNPGDNADSENHNRGNEMDSSGVSSEGQKDDNEHSGVGSEEGDKSARQAEALKAMGKISELFGKRAENVQGAVMIEVGTTRQQLKTPLSQSNAAHAEAGSEIHRDQVPLEYQQFVQQYFDKLRGTAPAATPPPAAPAK